MRLVCRPLDNLEADPQPPRSFQLVRTVEPFSLEAYKAHLALSQPEPKQSHVPHAAPARSLLPTLTAAAATDVAKDGTLPAPRAPQGFAQIGALIAAGRGGELVGDDVDDVTVHPKAAAVRLALLWRDVPETDIATPP